MRKLLDTVEGAGVASRWVLRSGRSPQFSLARALLLSRPQHRVLRFNWRRVMSWKVGTIVLGVLFLERFCQGLYYKVLHSELAGQSMNINQSIKLLQLLSWCSGSSFQARSKEQRLSRDFISRQILFLSMIFICYFIVCYIHLRHILRHLNHI
jgi:hypothetical protein